MRAGGYAMATALVDGNDVEAVYAAAVAAVVRAREGGGPTFIEGKTYRHRGHSRTDPAKYRDPAEVEAWMKRDPLLLYRAELSASRLLDDAGADRIVAESRAAPKAEGRRAAPGPWPWR